MSIRVILELQAKPGNADDLKKVFREALPDTRKYDGCRHVDIFENKDKPGSLVLVEEWDSRPQHEKYLAWRQGTGLIDRLGALLAGQPSIRFFDTVDA